MPKSRHRKKPVTRTDPGSSNTTVASSKPKSSRSVIRRYHTLLKKQAQLKKDEVKNRLALEEVNDGIGGLGGLEVYQKMSTLGQGNDRGGGSEKFFISWLKELGLSNCKDSGEKKTLLEVGALKPDNYHSCSSWINPTPIDLHSRHPSIQEQDFLIMNLDENKESWDLISLSLVVNFVPDPKDRGRMLQRAYTMLVPDGLLFLALPLPCVVNSRYMNFEHLTALMECIGFEEVKCKWKPNGKMAYWLFQKSTPQSSSLILNHTATPIEFTKKHVLRQGNRNNFWICL